MHISLNMVADYLKPKHFFGLNLILVKCRTYYLNSGLILFVCCVRIIDLVCIWIRGLNSNFAIPYVAI